jgi:hypothetical protein
MNWTLQVNLNGVAITPGSDVLLKLIPSIYTYTESARVRLFLFFFYSDFAVAKVLRLNFLVFSNLFVISRHFKYM